MLYLIEYLANVDARDADAKDDEAAYEPDGEDHGRPTRNSCAQDDGSHHVDGDAEGDNEEQHAQVGNGVHGLHAEGSNTVKGQVEHLLQGVLGGAGGE